MTHDEMIAVIAAHRDGKAVEALDPSFGKWRAATGPCWDFSRFDYRIKPEPMVVWVTVYPTHVGGVYSSEANANVLRGRGGTIRKFIEVIE